MKLTIDKIKKLIKEELNSLSEMSGGFKGIVEDEMPTAIYKSGDIPALNLIIFDEDFGFTPKALNAMELEDTSMPGKARTVGSKTIIPIQQEVNISLDGKFSLKLKNGQTLEAQLQPNDVKQLQQIKQQYF